MSKSRLEAFSDGVIAIAITLLVLEIHVPGVHARGGLAHALGEEWPSYVSYATSFLTIGIIWVNHHLALARLRSVNHGVLFLNLLLLLFIGLLPFTTALMAQYLRQSSGEGLAAGVYAGSFLAMSLAFLALQRYMLRTRPDLLSSEISPEQRDTIYKRSRAGVLPYVLATALAGVSPYLALAICLLLAGYYALPTTARPSG
jgi:uncharacterized membrane protein